MKYTFWYWIIAFMITIAAAVYQRATGPTYPFKSKGILNNEKIAVSLPRSFSLDEVAEIVINIKDTSIKGEVFYKRFPTNDSLISKPFSLEERKGKKCLVAQLPQQPPAGKLSYYIVLSKGNTSLNFGNEDHPVFIRFKGAVPAWVLIPHILLMFIGMMISNLTALLVIKKDNRYRLYTNITFLIILLGGMILGPIVQWYAFGDLWTGIPKGWDLTDNKMLIGFILWLIAIVGNWKKDRPYLSLIAAIMMLIIFSIPHSMFGSELNPTTGKIIQA